MKLRHKCLVNTVIQDLEAFEPDLNDHITTAKDELESYFEGSLNSFSVPLDFDGYSSFYQKVWHALLKIPFGKTQSYLDLARSIGDIKAVRAVGILINSSRISSA